MNEMLIENFASQADVETRNMNSIGAAVSPWKKRFAELIVLECAKVCDMVAADAKEMSNSDILTPNSKLVHEGMWGGATNSASIMMHHFGMNK